MREDTKPSLRLRADATAGQPAETKPSDGESDLQQLEQVILAIGESLISLVGDRVGLISLEIKAAASEAVRAGLGLIAGAVFGLLAWIGVSAAAALWLAERMPLWSAVGCVAALQALLAVVFVGVTRRSKPTARAAEELPEEIAGGSPPTPGANGAKTSGGYRTRRPPTNGHRVAFRDLPRGPMPRRDARVTSARGESKL